MAESMVKSQNQLQQLDAREGEKNVGLSYERVPNESRLINDQDALKMRTESPRYQNPNDEDAHDLHFILNQIENVKHEDLADDRGGSQRSDLWEVPIQSKKTEQDHHETKMETPLDKTLIRHETDQIIAENV